MYVHRAARILAPFLAGLVTILPLTGLLAIDFMLGVRFGTHDLIPDVAQVNILGSEIVAAGFPVDQPSPGHLWFLYYLLYFYLLIPACMFLVARSRPFGEGIRAFLASPGALVALGLYSAATLWPFQGGQVHEGFLFFKPHAPSLLYYGSFFAFGYLFHPYREILAAFARHTVWSAALAVVLFPISLRLSDLDRASHGELALLAVAAFTTVAGFVTYHYWVQRTWVSAFLNGRRFDLDWPWRSRRT